MDIIAVLFIEFFFQHYCGMHCKSYAYFTIPCPRLSVTLFTHLFLSKQTGHGRNIISFYFFLFISGRSKCLSREECVG